MRDEISVQEVGKSLPSSVEEDLKAAKEIQAVKARLKREDRREADSRLKMLKKQINKDSDGAS